MKQIVAIRDSISKRDWSILDNRELGGSIAIASATTSISANPSTSTSSSISRFQRFIRLGDAVENVGCSGAFDIPIKLGIGPDFFVGCGRVSPY